MTARLRVWLLLTAVLAGTALRLAQPSVLFRGPDEAVYAHYARTIAAKGAEGVAENIREYLREPQLSNFPTPLRLTYLAPLASLMKLTGDDTGERAGVLLSRTFSFLSLAVIALFGLRFFGFWPAFFGVVLLAFSPLELMLSRRVLQDGGAALLSGVALWQACRIAAHPGRRSPYAFFALAGAALFFFKETGAVVYGILAALCIGTLARRPAGALRLAAWSATIFVPALLLFFSLCGGPGAVLETLAANRRAGSGDIMAFFQDGPWHAFLEMQWLLGPASLALFFAGAAFIAARALRGHRDVPALLSLSFVALFFIAVCVPPNYKNARLLSPVHTPYFLIAGTGAAGLVSLAWARLTSRFVKILFAALVAAAAALSLFRDYDNYDKIFVDAELNEMIVVERLNDLSLYRKMDALASAKARVSRVLAAGIPDDETPAASESFYDALRTQGRPFHRLYRFICESRWSISRDARLPVASGPLDVPGEVRHILYEAMDFYFVLRPDQQKAVSEFFARGGWQPVVYGGNSVLFERGDSGHGMLYRVYPAGMPEPPHLLGASTGDIELRGLWLAVPDGPQNGVQMKLDWRALKDGPADYFMTLWVLDEKGRVLAEERRLIAYGLRPTSSWKAGERVVEHYRMILPDGLPERFEIRAGVGLIDSETLVPFTPSKKIDKNGLAVIGTFGPK